MSIRFTHNMLHNTDAILSKSIRWKRGLRRSSSQTTIVLSWRIGDFVIPLFATTLIVFSKLLNGSKRFVISFLMIQDLIDIRLNFFFAHPVPDLINGLISQYSFFTINYIKICFGKFCSLTYYNHVQFNIGENVLRNRATLA